MITENDLQAAIAECKGQRNPNANTCLKLAAFYTIMDHMNNEDSAPAPKDTDSRYSAGAPVGYSYAPNGDSEFLQKISTVDPDRAWSVIDEMVSAIKVLNPRLYAGVMRKLDDF